tara:strand:- start:557 stop:1093 length:537 start_codon:yes stop_codon:yes gene_type:complete
MQVGTKRAITESMNLISTMCRYGGKKLMDQIQQIQELSMHPPTTGKKVVAIAIYFLKFDSENNRPFENKLENSRMYHIVRDIVGPNRPIIVPPNFGDHDFDLSKLSHVFSDTLTHKYDFNWAYLAKYPETQICLCAHQNNIRFNEQSFYRIPKTLNLSLPDHDLKKEVKTFLDQPAFS